MRGIALWVLLAAAGAMVGCGGESKSQPPLDNRYFDGVTLTRARDCVEREGGRTYSSVPPALRGERAAVRRGGGDAFMVPYERGDVGGVYTFFVYINPTAARTAVPRLKRLVAKGLDSAYPHGAVFVARNLAVAAFDPIPRRISRAFEHCAAQ